MELQYKLYGEEDIRELNMERPIVYRSRNLISSVSNAGGNELLDKESNIPKNIRERLKELNLKYSFGGSGDDITNCNIFSPYAKYLDGNERICYMQGIDNESVLVMEYYGNRGAKYSAYYKLLLKKMREYNVVINVDNSFKVDINTIDNFIDAIRDIMRLRAENKLVFEAINDIYSIKIGGSDYYYYKAYWRNIEEIENKIIEVENLLDTIIESVSTIEDYKRVKNLLESYKIKLEHRI